MPVSAIVTKVWSGFRSTATSRRKWRIATASASSHHARAA
jgi:hypothetical protein